MQVIVSICGSATCPGLTAAARKPADTGADYIEPQTYVQYNAYLDAGLPIATGVIESDRMEITGARWSLEALRRFSGCVHTREDERRFEQIFRYHERQELEHNHAARYANGKIPSLRRPKRHHIARRTVVGYGWRTDRVTPSRIYATDPAARQIIR